MRKLLTSFCFFALLSSIHAIDAGDQVKMVLAKQKLFAGQYIGALNLYKEVLQKYPEDASLLYYVGKCHYELKNNEEALTTLKKAVATNKEVKPETHLLIGKIYLKDAKIEEALLEFNTYKTAASSKQALEEDVDV